MTEIIVSIIGKLKVPQQIKVLYRVRPYIVVQSVILTNRQ